jgi:nicotinamidase-related amidase
MELEGFLTGSMPFLRWLVDWYNSRPALPLSDVVSEAGGADRVAVMAVDVTCGFCFAGPLYSERVSRIVGPISELFVLAYSLGVRHFILPQDTHSESAVEFGSFPAHCMDGSGESETVPELRNLPFSERFLVIKKDSISSAIETELDGWLSGHPQVRTFLVVGDCTDLCVHQLAMHLRLRANALELRDVRVVVPINGVETFDIPVDSAEEIGTMPHSGDLLNLVFLYNMAENGVNVVARLSSHGSG